MEQIAYVRRVSYDEGKADGMQVIQVKSGELFYELSVDKCLDMVRLSYKGKTFSFLSKAGMQNSRPYDVSEHNAVQSIMGGMLFTCGTDNVGPAERKEASILPMHGSLRSLPAEHICADSWWDGDEYKIKVSGEIHQGQLFGKHIVLRRSIETVVGSNVIKIEDEFENQGFCEEAFMLLYHCNVGYPLLDEGSRVLVSSDEVRLRGEEKETVNCWDKVGAPVDLQPEEVYYHTFSKNREREYAAVINDTLGLGLKVEFQTSELPYMTQWKSMGSSDYVMGLEPCNCHVNGVDWEEKNGTLQKLKPLEKRNVSLQLGVLDKARKTWI